MATQPQIDPGTGERVQPQAPPEIDPNTGERVTGHGPIDTNKMTSAGIVSHMTGVPASTAYDNHDQVKAEFAKHGQDVPVTTRIANDIKVGAQGSVFGLAYRNKMPDELQHQSRMDQFISGLSQMVSDLPVYIGGGIMGGFVGGVAGSEVPVVGNVAGVAGGAAMGTFAIPEAMRKSLTLAIQKGGIKSFGDLMDRTMEVIKASEEGAITGLVTHGAGKVVPMGKVLGAAAPKAEAVLKNQQQAAALTLLQGLFQGRIPTAGDFVTNASLMGVLGLATHGVSDKQAAMDVYAKDGTHPRYTVTRLQAQPTVKPTPEPGLRPAIKLLGGDTPIVGEGETHSDLAQRVTGERPVDIDKLEADPKLADKVLANPDIQVQQVIDRAYELKQDSGEPTGPKPQSGRGFATTSGDYLSRLGAKNWVKANEPEVYQMWLDNVGDPNTEFHSQDYQEAHQRVNARTLAEGDPKFGVVDEVARFQAQNRSTLNGIKAGNVSEGYGNQVIRSTFDGPRKLVRSFGTQIEGRLRKLIPDSVDQEAMSFMRDYRDDPQALRGRIEEIRQGDNEQLKRAIPSMERALSPTPDMLEADKLITDGFTQANDLRRQYVGAESSIDPARYSPRNFMMAEDDLNSGQGSVSGGKFSKRSGHDIRREYEHILDPLMSGDVKARTFNAVDELGVYFDKLGVNVGRAVFETEIKNSELGKSGNLSKAPKNWVDLTGMSHTIIKTDPITGETTFVKTGFKVHPKVAEAMKPLLSGDELTSNKYFRGAKLMQGWVKGMELGLSLFHMRALSISFMNNAGLDAYRDALLVDNNSAEFESREREWASYGLETTKTSRPYEAYRGLQPSSIEDRSALLAKFQRGYEPFDTAFKATTKATFEVVQRKFKVLDASTRGASWLANHPQATDVEMMSAMRGIAKEVNAVYGGLNWEVMGVNPTISSMARLFFLAPDWTFSNVANLKYAGTGGPGGNAARAFWARSFITGLALNAAASIFFTGKLQDKEHWHEVSLGQDDNGHNMYTNVFFAGAPKDAITTYNLVMKHGFPNGLIQAGINKAGPIAGTLLHLATNKDFQGKPIEGSKADFVGKTISEGKFVGENLTPVPFTFGQLGERIMDPDKAISYKDFLFSIAAGAPVIHEGESKKQSSKFKLATKPKKVTQ